MTSSVVRIVLLFTLAMAASAAATWVKAYLAESSQPAQASQQPPAQHPPAGHG